MRGDVTFLSLLKLTANEWSEDKAPQLGAALAYYTIFSIAPLILIAVTITGLVFSNAQQEVLSQVRQLVGDKGAEAIQSMIAATHKPVQSAVATVLGFTTLLFGAAGVFVQLKSALNTIWNVDKSKIKGGFWPFVKKYFLSFTMVLGMGFLLMLSLLLEAGVNVMGQFIKDHIPGLNGIMRAIAILISFGIVTLLLALLFKFLPDVEVRWRDVWIGSLLTAGLFAIGKIGLGFYLGRATVASAYGAAGSLVIVLLWVYYSAQILFFGAEFTQVYSKYHGSRFDPSVLNKTLSPKERLVMKIDGERERIAKKLNRFQLKPHSR